MGHALPQETQEVVDRAARLAEVGRRMEAGDPVSLHGNPAKIIDLDKFESLLSDPSVTVAEACRACGFHRNTLYDRLPKDSTLRTVFNRAMLTRRMSKQVTMVRKYEGKKAKAQQPKPVTRSALELLASKLPDFNEAWPDEVKAKWLDAFGKIADEAA